MSMDGKVAAFSTRTGRATRVPPHYLDHPVLSEQYSAEPVVGTEDQRPTTSWNNDRIRDWADEHGIELPEDATKAQMLDVVDDFRSWAGDGPSAPTSTTDPAGTPPTDQTPA
ncbi:Ish1 domain-containing protein [Nocardioides sp. AX2bis]|uniref:Ish1 domain-containing protein n=1 Tax=Nocardioides sp. AX2bis TaxID=2653157 RepID=UPI0012EF3E52|nr:Ish1 domain-containing protein [Nocardioides sp. AX2bis]VXC44121.1 conserved hypothetical protein [Nocardioides sp. AX2bis]